MRVVKHVMQPRKHLKTNNLPTQAWLLNALEIMIEISITIVMAALETAAA